MRTKLTATILAAFAAGGMGLAAAPAASADQIWVPLPHETCKPPYDMYVGVYGGNLFGYEADIRPVCAA